MRRMSTPDQPTGAVPPPQQWPAGQYPPPPPPYPPVAGPPHGYYPPPPPVRKSFWSSSGGILTIIGICFGALVVLCGGMAVIGRAGDNAALSKIDVQLTSCGGTGSVAKVGYSVTNNGGQNRRVTIELEYRDSSGARLDTDTAYVGEVPAGDTVRGEESTILNATPANGAVTCKVTKVR